MKRYPTPKNDQTVLAGNNCESNTLSDPITRTPSISKPIVIHAVRYQRRPLPSSATVARRYTTPERADSR